MKLLFIFLIGSYTLIAQNTQVTPTSLKSINMGQLLPIELETYNFHARIISKVATGTPSNPGFPSTTSKILGIESFGMDNNIFSKGAEINFIPSQTWTSTSRGTDIQFRNYKNATANNVMTIAHNGKVGIGTVNPSAFLHIYNGNSNRLIQNYHKAILESNTENMLVLKGATSGIIFDKYVYSDNFEFEFNGRNGGNKYLQLSNYDDTFLSFVENDDKNSVSLGGFTTTNAKATLHEYALSRSTTITSDFFMHNYNRQKSSVIRIDNSPGIKRLTGINQPVDGLILYISVEEGGVLYLYNENTDSLPQNRIITHTANTLVITDGGATLIYDGLYQRWRVIGVAR
ncbi:MAG: hypothetical protein ACRCVT_09045 [Leadbetterella sp.]